MTAAAVRLAPAGARPAVFHARGLTKTYTMGEVQVHALQGVDLDLFEGDFVVILGLGRHNRFDRIFGGETAIEVMRHARVPVVAVPSTARGLPERALVAMDFTAASTAAAMLTAELVPRHGVLYVAHVCAFAGAPAEPGDLIDLYREGARSRLDSVVEKIRRRADCGIESLLLEGEPADALLKFAKREHCGLIAMGGHELGLVDRILLGSIRTKVIRGATCSVLIAPPSV